MFVKSQQSQSGFFNEFPILLSSSPSTSIFQSRQLLGPSNLYVIPNQILLMGTEIQNSGAKLNQIANMNTQEKWQPGGFVNY